MEATKPVEVPVTESETAPVPTAASVACAALVTVTSGWEEIESDRDLCLQSIPVKYSTMARIKQYKNGKRVVVANSRKTRAVKAPRKLLGGKGKAIAQLKKENRKRPGTKALQETRRYRGTFDMSIPKAPFQQLVREIMSELGGRGMRIQSSALLALQESAEALLVAEFDLMNPAAIHAKRVTTQVKDMKLVQRMRLGMMGISKIGERPVAAP
ncbi:histone H3.2-like protein [Hyaloscypha finlandica]|nr:histone H3.2-like protein [Hyaloscypha finlandica]